MHQIAGRSERRGDGTGKSRELLLDACVELVGEPGDVLVRAQRRAALHERAASEMADKRRADCRKLLSASAAGVVEPPDAA